MRMGFVYGNLCMMEVGPHFATFVYDPILMDRTLATRTIKLHIWQYVSELVQVWVHIAY